MQQNAKFQRKHLRAPLKSEALYIDDDHVFKARTLNISEGGILLCELPHVPDINAIPMMVALIHYPKLGTLSPEKIKSLNPAEFPRSVIKLKARMVRTFEGKSTVEKLFLTHIGCELYPPPEEVKKEIIEYVNTFAKNTVYLLSLFESNHHKKEQVELVRKVAELLGYDATMAMPLLRQKVLHDYQSLESL